jgi:hypothetical protein
VRLTTGLVLWIVAAGAATAVGLAAVAAIGTDIFGAGQDPLSQSEVDALLSSQPPTPSASTPTTSTPTTTAPPPAVDTSAVTQGGTVISRCTPDGLVEVRSATPAQGFQLEHEDSLDDHPSVKFTNGRVKVEIRLRCVNGMPSPDIKTDD